MIFTAARTFGVPIRRYARIDRDQRGLNGEGRWRHPRCWLTRRARGIRLVRSVLGVIFGIGGYLPAIALNDRADTVSMSLEALFPASAIAVGVPADARLSLPHIILKNQGLTLGKWLLIGPLTANPRESGLETDFLAKLGIKENWLSCENIAHLKIDRRGAIPLLQVVDRGDLVNFEVLFKMGFAPPTALETIAYAACEIDSAQAAEGWMLLGSDDGAKVWLNGELCYTCRDSRNMRVYDDAIRLPLRPGKNLLLVKVNNIAGFWQMTARLEPNLRSAIRTVLTRPEGYFRHSVLTEGIPLSFYVKGLLKTTPLTVKIETAEGREVNSLKLRDDSPAFLSGLPHGFYRAAVCLGGEHYETSIEVGSIAELYTELKMRCEGLRPQPEERVAINLDTLLRRLAVLSRPYQASPNDPAGAKDAFLENSERKAIYYADALFNALKMIGKQEEPFCDRPGLHLRGFRSRIDDQVQHYELFVPTTYRRDGPGLPLVVVLPTSIVEPRPFIESVFVADHRSAAALGAVAEKLKLGLLWAGYRGPPYGNPAEFADLDQLLATVAADYHLDTSRLYLYGYCSSGMTASMEALRHPTRYAAAAYLDPVLLRSKTRLDDTREYATNPTYREWIKETNPFEGFAKLTRLPVWIVNDADSPGHGPLWHTREFLKWAGKYGHYVRNNNNIGLFPPPTRVDTTARQFAWLLEQRNKVAADLTFHGEHENGPIARILAERFIVVRGTLGSTAEKIAAHQWCRDFQNAWLRTNFCPCRVIDDSAFSDNEQETGNLVLIGNPDTNAVWRKLATKLKIEMDRNEIRVEGKRWKGQDLAIEIWYANPNRPSCKVVLIGAKDLIHAAVGTMELAFDGWFDYAVWENGGAKPELLATGRFGIPETEWQKHVGAEPPQDVRARSIAR